MDVDMQPGIVLPDIYCLNFDTGEIKARPKHKANLPVNALYKYNIGRSKSGSSLISVLYILYISYHPALKLYTFFGQCLLKKHPIMQNMQ